jgi:hypothetical protein
VAADLLLSRYRREKICMRPSILKLANGIAGWSIFWKGDGRLSQHSRNDSLNFTVW